MAFGGLLSKYHRWSNNKLKLLHTKVLEHWRDSLNCKSSYRYPWTVSNTAYWFLTLIPVCNDKHVLYPNNSRGWNSSLALTLGKLIPFGQYKFNEKYWQHYFSSAASAGIFRGPRAPCSPLFFLFGFPVQMLVLKLVFRRQWSNIFYCLGGSEVIYFCLKMVRWKVFQAFTFLTCNFFHKTIKISVNFILSS